MSGADGSQHAGSAYDGERDAWLRAQGWRILRVWDNDIFINEGSVLTAILAALAAPLPAACGGCRSPARGEGEGKTHG